jgi:hypothetical protein
MPWHNLTGMARTVTLCAVTFLVSTGLCGLNLAISKVSDSTVIAVILTLTGGLELVAMVTSLAFLIFTVIAFVVQRIACAFRKSEPEE